MRSSRMAEIYGGSLMKPEYASTAMARAIPIAVLISAMVCAFLFIVFRGHVVVNRYTDATWHMAVADEFARTGIFAKDPFIPNAPAFSQFGLWDYVNGLAHRALTLPSERVFVISNGLTSALFLLASYLAGVLATGRAAYGVLSLVTISATVAMKDTTVIRAGWPFALATCLLFLSLASLCRFLERASRFFSERSRSEIRYPFTLLTSAFGIGVLIGVVFSLHAFVGLFSILTVSLILLPYAFLWHRSFSRVIVLAALAAAGFLAVASPWLVMHISLRGILAEGNAHLYSPSPPKFGIINALALCVLAGMLFHVRGINGCRMKRLTYVLGVTAFISAFLALPAVNVFVARITSGFMAERVLCFFPSGLLIASVPAYVAAINIKPTFKRLVSSGVLLVFAVLIAPVLFREAKGCYYMWRTKDYDSHEYADLLRMKHLGIGRQIVLSDPFTSYFARRFLYTYAVTVPAGHASPSIDYPTRDAIWMNALHEPRKAMHSIPFDYVLFNKKPRIAGGELDSSMIQHAVSNWSALAFLVFEDDAFSLFQFTQDGVHRALTQEGEVHTKPFTPSK